MKRDLYTIPALPECAVAEHPLRALLASAQSPAQAEALESLSQRLHHVNDALVEQEEGLLALLTLLGYSETQSINCALLECLLMPIVARLQHTTTALHNLID
ncbi:DUF1484 family protein [Chitinilyticum litopenaei]|uniref:DUF1484 family protein n=1 Tax=Chitinilyticum litopenaei TaxID=1121276 RepID=UPI000490959E|nr:DUF1484 family protein [Chitinilyticum litopenaei]